jgi:arabinosaccharide transport system substrate-binding protein
MKKKFLSVLLCTSMVATLVSGCGSSKVSTVSDSVADGSEESAAEESEVITTTAGDENGTHFEMWSFVEIHNSFYASIVDKWNEENPDRTIFVSFTTYPYADMHNKLLMSLQAGTGAPDICDVELGQFPNIVAGEDTWLYPLDTAIAPYKDFMVQARLDTYASKGHYYGVPFHVGATVMYYNASLLEKYGIDYTQIKTWNDYTEAGKKLKEASNGEVSMTSVDTAGTDWMWLAMSEYGEDWTGGEGNDANVQLESVKNMLTMQQSWLEEGVAEITPDGQIDCEAGFQNILDHNIASFPKALWYMSRFTNYMPEEKGNWAIAKCPVFEEGQNCSVGIGGTGTVVTQQSSEPELAADFLCYAKCSTEGVEQIWEQLGFDVCNTDVWTDTSITQDTSNQYISFFRTNPFDVLNEIKNNIGKISVTSISPAINEQICNTTLNQVLEAGMSVDDALQEAQDTIELEE